MNAQPVEAHHLIQRVVHRTQVWIDFLSEIARRNPNRSPASTAAAREHSTHTIRSERLNRTGNGQIGLTCTAGPIPKVSPVFGCPRGSRVDECLAPYSAAWHSYRVVMLVWVADNLPGLTLLQRQVDSSGVTSSFFARSNSSRNVSSALSACADDPEIIARRGSHVQACFQQPQILIQRAAQIREPRIVGGLELKLSLSDEARRGSRWSGVKRRLEFSGEQPAAQRVRTEFRDHHVTN